MPGGGTVSLSKLRRWLYLAQRALGDYQAARRGPEVLAKRVGRRHATRTIMRGITGR